ncbi:MAG: DUF262 domain-containing protein [Ruminococcaceae bacterium]|nr:DUF262 domain-containing protein [Oscillospiraceae bacterium]
MSKIGTRTVLGTDEYIKGKNFIVKEYQRGYRWGKQQVEDLLKDLLEFNPDNHRIKYCMQPLVVKRVPAESVTKARELANIIGSPNTADVEEPEVAWELIDGQQRLTTTLLILDSCYSNLRKPPKLPYNIAYSLVRDIDEYYITEAKTVIDAWFEQFGDEEDNKKNEIKGKIDGDIQFVWYEVDEDINSVDVFTRLNIGKIPLTNAELFKALLLNPDHAPEDSIENEKFKIRLSQIAFEWDKIEQSLRDDDFWNFISNEEREGETRIDYLLQLYALRLIANGQVPKKEVDKTVHKSDELFSFIIINKYMKSSCVTASEIWEKIVSLHDTLKYWYDGGEDSRLYHYIGFLVATSGSGIGVISNLIQNAEGKRKGEMENYVISLVRESMKNVKLEELSYHKDRAKIQKALLLFNVQTLIQSKTDQRFSFKHYKDKKTSWEIEHIHARATDEEIRAITQPNKRAEFLHALQNQFAEIDDMQTVQEIEAFIQNEVLTEKVTDDQFFEFCCIVTDKYGDFDENSLGNLTLLDAQTNHSYHNALYPIKRQKIIERDKGDVFIPVCTKNVFLKMYSSKFSNMMEWTKDDAEEYLEAMKTLLVKEAKLCQ